MSIFPVLLKSKKMFALVYRSRFLKEKEKKEKKKERNGFMKQTKILFVINKSQTI